MFRADTMSYASKYILRMFGIGKAQAYYYWHYYITNVEIIAMVIALVCAVPLFRNITQLPTGRFAAVKKLALNAWLLVLFLLSAASIADATFNPFIYFRF